MPFLQNPHLDLTISRIETDRCILVPFSTDGRVDIRELAEEFCKANKDLFVSPSLPNYEQELEYVDGVEKRIKKWEEFENFVFDKYTMRFIGCGGIRILETGESNIGIWIRVDEHSKWYATEVYIWLLSIGHEQISDTNISDMLSIHAMLPVGNLLSNLVGFFSRRQMREEMRYIISHSRLCVIVFLIFFSFQSLDSSYYIRIICKYFAKEYNQNQSGR